LISIVVVFLDRRFFVPESELIFTSTRTWGMLGFSFLAFLQSMGGILAAWEAVRLKEENPWDKIDINEIITKNIEK
jgi:cellulose synthase (UDP-forming)